jgi:hypothetical protein
MQSLIRRRKTFPPGDIHMGDFVMIRSIAYATAAILLTTGTVAAMADTGNTPIVRVDHKTGAYCLQSDAITGSHLPQVECHSVSDWAKQGVTFSRR